MSTWAIPMGAQVAASTWQHGVALCVRCRWPMPAVPGYDCPVCKAREKQERS